MKVFFDTNVVLDLIDDKRDKHHKAVDILKELLKNDAEIFVSEDMLSTIYYICKNKDLVLEFIEFIITEWQVVAYGENMIKQAIEYCKTNEGDFEDALQCFCAKNNQCQKIYTNDKNFVRLDVELATY